MVYRKFGHIKQKAKDKVNREKNDVKSKTGGGPAASTSLTVAENILANIYEETPSFSGLREGIEAGISSISDSESEDPLLYRDDPDGDNFQVDAGAGTSSNVIPKNNSISQKARRENILRLHPVCYIRKNYIRNL